MVEVNGERLLARLHTLRTFGAQENGVVRQTFSDIDMAARHWLRDEMADAGLDAAIDGVGNVIGRSPNPGPAVLTGSHSDTQPTGGWLDGAMGVIYGIEVAQALLEDPETAHLAVDAVSWVDEESTYVSFLGSRSFCDELTPADFEATNDAGETVTDAIVRVGLADTARSIIDPSRYAAFIEAHIEQGPHLESGDNLIGVVTSIVGIRAMQLTFTGEQNHAGTTPMPSRADAGVAMFEFGTEIRTRLEAIAGPTTVWTIGNARLLPGAESIIPGEAWCGLQFRDPSDELLDRIEDTIVELAAEMDDAGPVAVRAERRRNPHPPADMDPAVQQHLADAADRHAPEKWVRMPSAALHDAAVLAGHVPSGMLFIPSIDGISHDFAEDSRHDDIVLGANVLADAIAALLA